MEIKVGNRCRIKPAQLDKNTGYYAGREEIENKKWMDGTIVRVNEDHRWFSVRVPFNNGTYFTETFNFCDIGKNVVLL